MDIKVRACYSINFKNENLNGFGFSSSVFCFVLNMVVELLRFETRESKQENLNKRPALGSCKYLGFLSCFYIILSI